MPILPSLSLLEGTLIKIREDQAEEAIVITPRWPRRPWYHLLLHMACEILLLLLCRHDLLSQLVPDNGVPYHIGVETLQLTA